VELGNVNTELNTQTIALGDINAELDTQTIALGDINTELNTQTVALSDVNASLNNIESYTLELANAIEVNATAVTVATKGLMIAGAAPDSTFRFLNVSTLGRLSVDVDSAPVTAVTNANLDVALSTLNAEATQLLIKAKADNLDVALSTVAKDTTLLASNVLTGAVTETAPVTDTGSSGLNGRLQRIAQNISSLITKLPAALGITTAAGSLSIAPASDAIFNTKPKAVTGTYAENLALTTVATFIAPANAIGAIVQADDANAVSFRAKQGAIATATSGVQFQAGRSEEFKSGSDISVCSEGASVKVYVQWFIQS
jgi:hypothetical protein